MTKLTKIMSAVALIFMGGIMLCGCSAISYSYLYLPDGSRVEEFTFELDASKVASVGIQPDELFGDIQGLVSSWIIQQSLDPDKKNLIDSGKVTIKSDISDTPYTQIVQIHYADSDTYLRFYGEDPDAPDKDGEEEKWEHGLFMDKNIIYDGEMLLFSSLTDPAAGPNIFTQVRDNITEKYFGGDTAIVDSLLGEVEINVIQAYPSALHVHSNADRILRTGNMDFHIWQASMDNPTAHMSMYQNYFSPSNRAACYIACIVATVIFGGIMLLIYFFRKPKPKPAETLNIMIADPNDDTPRIFINTYEEGSTRPADVWEYPTKDKADAQNDTQTTKDATDEKPKSKSDGPE